MERFKRTDFARMNLWTLVTGKCGAYILSSYKNIEEKKQKQNKKTVSRWSASYLCMYADVRSNNVNNNSLPHTLHTAHCTLHTAHCIHQAAAALH